MENEPSSSEHRTSFKKADYFLRQIGLRSEAYLKGDDWVKSTVADLRLDLWLLTEHGEVENDEQAAWIHRQIEVYQKVLTKSIFDPDSESIDGGLAIQVAASDLGQYVLAIATSELKEEENFSIVADRAIELLMDSNSRNDAASCMQRVSQYRGVIYEDIDEVIQRATRLLSLCK